LQEQEGSSEPTLNLKPGSYKKWRDAQVALLFCAEKRSVAFSGMKEPAAQLGRRSGPPPSCRQYARHMRTGVRSRLPGSRLAPGGADGPRMRWRERTGGQARVHDRAGDGGPHREERLTELAPAGVLLYGRPAENLEKPQLSDELVA